MASHGSPLSIFQDVPRSTGRRTSVRQKVHTPAYVSFNGFADGMVLDLSEVLELSETGMSIRTNAPIVPNRSLNLVLDLSETKTYINMTGFVVWTDKSGRAGIQFSKLPDSRARQLKEWLFFNALTAAAKAVAKNENIISDTSPLENDEDILDSSLNLQMSPAVVEEEEILEVPGSPPLGAPLDETVDTCQPGFASAVQLPQPEPQAEEQQLEQQQIVADAPGLNAIRQQVEALSSSLDAALNLLVERARSMTRASGAAIALAQDDEMVCRASSGEAPPLGARFQVGSGFSGECVRTGKLQRCDDSETDSLVDRESCRALGIRSMIAAPVIASGKTIGLLEVFSPDAYTFEEGDAVALRRLAEIIGHSAHSVVLPHVQPVAEPQPSTAQSRWDLRSTLLRLMGNKTFLIAAVAVLALTIVVLFTIWIRHRPAPQAAAPPNPVPAQVTPERPVAETLADLRKYADEGDPIAQFALGARYARGVDVKLDQTEAARWFLKAAEQGHVGAQAALGAYYWAGRGVPQDLPKAYFWSALARANGDEGSKYRVANLSVHMTRSQIMDAQQRANDWLQRHQSSASLAH